MKQLEKKQKILLVVTVIVIAILTWQFYELFWGDVSGSSTPAKVQPVKKAKQSTTKKGSVNAKKSAHSASVGLKVESNLPKSVAQRKATLPAQQAAYLNIVNHYELAKMENQLLTQQASIAEARNRIAKLNQDTMQLGGNVALASSNNTTTGFQLAYLGQQNGQWVAAIRNQDQYKTVSVNQQLPDGSVVLGIDKQGVLLKKGTQELRLTFQGVFVINSPKTVLKALNMADKTSETSNQGVLNNHPESLEDLVKVAKQTSQSAIDEGK